MFRRAFQRLLWILFLFQLLVDAVNAVVVVKLIATQSRVLRDDDGRRLGLNYECTSLDGPKCHFLNGVSSVDESKLLSVVRQLLGRLRDKAQTSSTEELEQEAAETLSEVPGLEVEELEMEEVLTTFFARTLRDFARAVAQLTSSKAHGEDADMAAEGEVPGSDGGDGATARKKVTRTVIVDDEEA